MAEVKEHAGKKIARGTGRSVGWLFRAVTLICILVFFIGGGLLIGGFMQFSNHVTGFGEEQSKQKVDGIVVLTGGRARIAEGLELMSKGQGKRLLISGVNKDTTVADLRSINTNQTGIFDCCVDLEHMALDTIGNAIESKKWANSLNYSSLMVVTSSYHMPRSLLEFRRQMPKMTILPFAVQPAGLASDDWWKNSDTLRLMMSEYLKYVGASSSDFISPNVMNSVRATLSN